MFLCLAYCSQLTCVECIFFFFCITSKSSTLLHIHTLSCILVHLLLIVIITTITIALVLKNKVFFFLVWHREFRNWHRDGAGMNRATEIWYLGMQNMAFGGSCVMIENVEMGGWKMLHIFVNYICFESNVLPQLETLISGWRTWTLCVNFH